MIFLTMYSKKRETVRRTAQNRPRRPRRASDREIHHPARMAVKSPKNGLKTRLQKG